MSRLALTGAALSAALFACGGAPPPADHRPEAAPAAQPSKGPAMLAPDKEPEGIACEIHLDAADLPQRTELMIERDRGAVSVAANTLAGTSNRGRPRAAPSVDTRALRQAAASDNARSRRAAAILIGRCKAADPEADQRLVETLAGLTADAQPPEVRIEAAMSQRLRGVGDDPDAALVTLSEGDAAPWRAAAYLAQTGEARGWPAVARGAASDDAPSRVEALEAAVAFAPMQGKEAGDTTVDPHGLIAGAADDEAVTVRQSVPRWLIEVEHPEARARIEALTKDASSGVQTMAKHALGQLDERAR